MSSVKLAIRVRPFTERELKSEKDNVQVVNVVDDNTVTITNIKVSTSGAGDSRERVRNYFCDYAFNSSCSYGTPKYASQEKIFDTIGRDVLSNMSRGLSACVLAYGQSATGKTFTMMGSASQPGLLPRLCSALAEHHAIGVTVSFLEIYNERVHDLLSTEAAGPCHSLPRRRGNTRKDLRVREHPARGPYVQNLRRVAVSDVKTLVSLVEEGARQRRTAATKRNSTSSRSHAVLELITPIATLHLADLAGSEKASWDGSYGGRQKEGANINKSLVALSNVISALVSGGGRGRFVPYRDSALTWLLKDCFTGGATTFIIATVSPSAACYGESASTLRWAARARRLPAPRATFAGPANTAKAALQAQLDRLLDELARNHIRYIPETGRLLYDDSHWALQVRESKKNTTIGNLFSDMLNKKTEVQNAESKASSVSSGSSDVINAVDKSINDDNYKEVDKVFGPALERTRSGSDIELTAPLRHKRRHYKSQEVLPIVKPLPYSQKRSSLCQEKLSDAEAVIVKPPSVPILYDNQRAEIVASVTERLYTKLKKKEEATVANVETTLEKKIMEPLSELRICTNARQRLMDLNQRVARNKRRIGIPVHTQTRVSVIRVKDQGIDVQTDLESYLVKKENVCTIMKDASTETTPMTPRCKEIATGSVYGSLNLKDSSTFTDNKSKVLKNSFAMTETVSNCNFGSQTPIRPPPRRRKHIKVSRLRKSENGVEKCKSFSPLISINICQQYETESGSQSSDDNSQSSDDNVEQRVCEVKPIVNIKPDVLTNHKPVNVPLNKDEEVGKVSEFDCENICMDGNTGFNNEDKESLESSSETEKEFPDSEYYPLPRVTVKSSRPASQGEMIDIILGRNEVYPYNIILSPPHEIDNKKRMVNFRDNEIPVPGVDNNNKTEKIDDGRNGINIRKTLGSCKEEYETCNQSQKSTSSDSTDCTLETNSFIWNQGDDCKKKINLVRNKTGGSFTKEYTPVYNNNLKYKNAITKMYTDYTQILGFSDSEDKICKDHSGWSSNMEVTDFDRSKNELIRRQFMQKRKFFEDILKVSSDEQEKCYDSLEENLMNACSQLEITANNYEKYLAQSRSYTPCYTSKNVRKPTEYLQHLVQIRRHIVGAAGSQENIYK